MQPENSRVLHHFIEDSFQDDIVERELRLSWEELEYLKSSFPNASITKICDSHDDKTWYKINIANH